MSIENAIYVPEAGDAVNVDFVNIGLQCSIGEKLALTYEVENSEEEFCCLYAAIRAAQYPQYSNEMRVNTYEELDDVISRKDDIIGTVGDWVRAHPVDGFRVVRDWVLSHPEVAEALKSSVGMELTSVNPKPIQELDWYIATLYGVRDSMA